MSRGRPLETYHGKMVKDELKALGCIVEKERVYPPVNGWWRTGHSSDNHAWLEIDGGIGMGGSEPVVYHAYWKKIEWVINGKSYVKELYF